MVIQSRVSPPDWTDHEGGGESGARCRVFQISRDPDGIVRNDTWFQDAEQALPVCNGWGEDDSPCPMRASCLKGALINNEMAGVWGGMTLPQRRWIRRNLPREHWLNDSLLREMVPPPGYFSGGLGNEDPEEEARLDGAKATEEEA